MNLHEAGVAIRAILDEIPDHLLPRPTKTDQYRHEEYGTCHWFGGHGYYLGSCRDGKGNPIPNDFRLSGISALFELETMQRLESAFWNEKAEVSR